MIRTPGGDALSPPPHPDFNPDDPDWERLASAPPGYWSIAQLYMLGFVEPYSTQYENLDVIPSHTTDLTRFLQDVKKSEIDAAVIGHLAEILNDEYFQSNYDIAIIDTPPQVSPITSSVVRAATHILIPTEMQEDSIQGMVAMATVWRNENYRRSQENELKMAGILPTKYNQHASLQKQYYKDLCENEEINKYLLTPMRHMITYQTSSASFSDPKSLFDLHENNICRQEAVGMCKEIIARIGL